MNDWTNKKVLITGGTSGLGRELALQLRAQGAEVAIVARHPEKIPKRLDEGIVVIQADVSLKEDIYRISAEAIAKLGGIDLLVNNASYLGETPLRLLVDTECEDFGKVLETNLLGVFRLTKALLPTMLLDGTGTILNITSDAGVSAYPRWGAYGTSKAALAHLSAIWNEELKDAGVRFFAIDPGDMDTPMHAAAVPTANRSLLFSPKEAANRILEKISEGQSS